MIHSGYGAATMNQMEQEMTICFLLLLQNNSRYKHKLNRYYLIKITFFNEVLYIYYEILHIFRCMQTKFDKTAKKNLIKNI